MLPNRGSKRERKEAALFENRDVALKLTWKDFSSLSFISLASEFSSTTSHCYIIVHHLNVCL